LSFAKTGASYSRVPLSHSFIIVIFVALQAVAEAERLQREIDEVEKQLLLRSLNEKTLDIAEIPSGFLPDFIVLSPFSFPFAVLNAISLFCRKNWRRNYAILSRRFLRRVLKTSSSSSSLIGLAPFC